MIEKDIMLDVIDNYGYINPKKFADLFSTTIEDIALISGISLSELIEKNQYKSILTQKRLYEIILIINTVIPWCDDVLQAYYWYCSKTLPSFGNLTAEELVKQDMYSNLIKYLLRSKSGGYT